MTPPDFITTLLPLAQQCRRVYGVPVSVVIAQAALETGWGEKVKANNLFNIKADASWHGAVAVFATNEFVKGTKTPLMASFRLYKSWADSVNDYGLFLRSNPRYAPCFKQTTGEGWAQALQAAGYATDPNYAASLIAIMQGRKMAQYDTVLPTT